MINKEDKPLGLDLVDWQPDYTKTWEENWEIYREKYFKVYGEYPTDPDSNLEPDNNNSNF